MQSVDGQVVSSRAFLNHPAGPVGVLRYYGYGDSPGRSKVVDRTKSLLGAAWAPCVCGLVAGHVGCDLYNAIGIQLNLLG